MTRKLFASAIILLLLTALFSGAIGETAEGLALATPTDLECLHEHVQTIIYFFDGPAYYSISSASHRVSGPATVETVCLDCGEVLSSVRDNNAEEIRPHRMKKGVCALCGYRERTPVKTTVKDLPGERTLFAQEEGKEGLLTLTLSSLDLTALENAHVNTVLVRGPAGEAAIALQVQELLAQTERSKADLRLELAEREDGSFFAGVALDSDPVEPEGISLRFYQQKKADIRISLAPAGEDILLETEGTWDENGYWSVPYIQEGTYILIQN